MKSIFSHHVPFSRYGAPQRSISSPVNFGPRISETVRDRKKRLSYSESASSTWSKAGIEVKFSLEANNGPRHLAVPARIKNQNLTPGGPVSRKWYVVGKN